MLEKAYAKLHGSYEHLEGGFFSEALVDFIGGIPEFIDMRMSGTEPKAVFSKILKAQQCGAHIGASILKATKPDMYNGAYENGLYPGHAYTITKAKYYKGMLHSWVVF